MSKTNYKTKITIANEEMEWCEMIDGLCPTPETACAECLKTSKDWMY
jgi:hypothetical protein